MRCAIASLDVRDAETFRRDAEQLAIELKFAQLPVPLLHGFYNVGLTNYFVMKDNTVQQTSCSFANLGQ